MKKNLRKVLCLVLLVFSFGLTGCLDSSYMDVEYSTSTNKIQYKYTFKKDKEIETWKVSATGTKAEFYLNDELYESKVPTNGGTSCTIEMTDLSFVKGDVFVLIVTGTTVNPPATYGTVIDGETLKLFFS